MEELRIIKEEARGKERNSIHIAIRYEAWFINMPHCNNGKELSTE